MHPKRVSHHISSYCVTAYTHIIEPTKSNLHYVLKEYTGRFQQKVNISQHYLPLTDIKLSALLRKDQLPPTNNSALYKRTSTDYYLYTFFCIARNSSSQSLTFFYSYSSSTVCCTYSQRVWDMAQNMSFKSLLGFERLTSCLFWILTLAGNSDRSTDYSQP